MPTWIIDRCLDGTGCLARVHKSKEDRENTSGGWSNADHYKRAFAVAVAVAIAVVGPGPAFAVPSSMSAAMDAKPRAPRSTRGEHRRAGQGGGRGGGGAPPAQISPTRRATCVCAALLRAPPPLRHTRRGPRRVLGRCVCVCGRLDMGFANVRASMCGKGVLNVV